jgi:hypothetical protein
LVILATTGILIWSEHTGNFKHKSSNDQDVQTPPPHRMNSTRPHGRDHPGPRDRPTREDVLSTACDIGLPRPIEEYLDVIDDKEAEKLYPFVHDYIGYGEVETLALRFHRSESGQNTERIILLLSDLKTADSLSSARNMVLQENLQVEDPVLIACATSLAKNGGQDSIQAILERLNRVSLDDSGHIPENTVPLIGSLALASAPELEWFIGQAAEGKWIATSPTARLAAVNALRSYPNIHTTSILARLRNSEDSAHIRGLATDVLARIQQQDSE